MSISNKYRKVGVAAAGLALAAGLGVSTSVAQADAAISPKASDSEPSRSAEPLARPKFKMPFKCGQRWRGNNWAGHKPPNTIDWNKGSGNDDRGKPVLASAAGKVKRAGKVSGGGYGKMVVIAHGNGWATRYAHLRSMGVKKGDKVRRGQRIGRVGKTGGQATTHLHYEQRHRKQVVTPVVQGIRWDTGTDMRRPSKNC